MGVVKKFLKLTHIPQIPICDKGDTRYPEHFVIKYLRSWNSKLKQDRYGNLYLINPNTPLICAHMDKIQHGDDRHLINTIKRRGNVIKGKDVVIGGDDKCGIAVAMQLYEDMGDNISLLFTRQEETGCNGIRAFTQEFPGLLNQCTYCLVIDRKGNGDIIGYDNQFCSKEFELDVAEFSEEYGYKPVRGGISDTGTIAKYINAVNLSAGYYNPHTKQEFVVTDDLEMCYYNAFNLVNNLEGDWDIYRQPVKTYGDWSKYKGYRGSLFSDEDDDENATRYF